MYIDSPNISGSLTITGSLILNGTAVTASGGGGGSGAGFPFSGSAVITGSLYVSGGNISGSFVGDGAGITGVTINQFATFEDTFTNAPSHSAVHNFNTKNVFVQVFESDDTLLIPYSVTTTTANQVDIVFGDTLSGRVVIGKAGHILQDTGNFVSSSTAVQTFTNATTASINHYLDSFNVITQVFDSNNNVIVPSNIKVATKDRVDLTFASSRSGKVVIAKAGHIVSGTAAVSASFATTSERVRAGSSGSRPTDYANIETGSLWYNTDTLALEAFTGVSGSWWQPIGSASVSEVPVIPYSVEYLLIAGGGSGGGGTAGTPPYGGGGGGAGGYLSSSVDFTPNSVYTITVGAGGSFTAGVPGTNGDDSSIAGYGFSTITALGGGGGAEGDDNVTNKVGKDGGSGGGGGYQNGVGGSGTVGQGNDGATNDSTGTGGGGGGAGAAANNSPTSGDGGDGLQSNITGVLTYRAGGGGGGDRAGDSANTYGDPGQGGGGKGASDFVPHDGDPGTANTGGGGGGASTDNRTGGAGGSGVAILRIPTSKYSGTYTGASVTVSTVGADTILIYSGSGTYTA